MNEQIKELAKQAKTETNGHFEGPAFDWNDWHSHFNKKFAELIVRECAMFVVIELEGQVGSRIADATANRLEEHFGVE